MCLQTLLCDFSWSRDEVHVAIRHPDFWPDVNARGPLILQYVAWIPAETIPWLAETVILTVFRLGVVSKWSSDVGAFPLFIEPHSLKWGRKSGVMYLSHFKEISGLLKKENTKCRILKSTDDVFSKLITTRIMLSRSNCPLSRVDGGFTFLVLPWKQKH